jgi:acetoin utilization deacetylase AcuC-like enzyme
LYRQAIVERLIPALRAFNPSLILLSMGFDAAIGDVGNYRTAGGKSMPGMDMQPEDFEWVTTEVMRIADLCCGGRLVSVLEGGYGSYSKIKKHVPVTRTMSSRNFNSETEEVGNHNA